MNGSTNSDYVKQIFQLWSSWQISPKYQTLSFAEGWTEGAFLATELRAARHLFEIKTIVSLIILVSIFGFTIV
jgi:hypothetical protein